MRCSLKNYIKKVPQISQESTSDVVLFKFAGQQFAVSHTRKNSYRIYFPVIHAKFFKITFLENTKYSLV